MKNYVHSLIKKRISEVAREYRKKGYEVKIEPRKENLPNFLSEFQPDLIAKSDKENVIIEIKSKEGLSKAEYLIKLAKSAQVKLGWRFELIIVNPKMSQIDLFKENIKAFNENEILETLLESKRLINLRSLNASLLLCWSAVEGAMRLLAERNKITLKKDNPEYILKELFYLNLINFNEYNIINKGIILRNSIIHGFKIPELKTDVILKLSNMAEKIVHSKMRKD